MTFIYVVHNLCDRNLEAVGDILLILVSVQVPTFLGYSERIRGLIETTP